MQFAITCSATPVVEVPVMTKASILKTVLLWLKFYWINFTTYDHVLDILLFWFAGEYRQNLCSSKDTNCAPCPTRLPSCVGLPDGLNSLAGAQWTAKYILCYKNRTLDVSTCKLGVFNPVKRVCDNQLRPGRCSIFHFISHNFLFTGHSTCKFWT